MSDVGPAPYCGESLPVPPHSLDAESCVVGGLMLDNSVWDDVRELVSADDFYGQDQRLVFEAIEELFIAESRVDLMLLSDAMKQSGSLRQIGGFQVLGRFARNTPTAKNAFYYARVVRDASIKRQLLSCTQGIQRDVYDGGNVKAAVLLDSAEAALLSIANDRQSGQFLNVNDLLTQAVDRIDELYNSDSAITGIECGFADLDVQLSGLQRSDFIVISGRPSMGKTSLAMNMVEHVACVKSLPAAVFSMEMKGSQLMMRMLGSLGRIDQGKLRSGNLDDEDWPRLTGAVAKLQSASIFVDQRPGMGVSDVRAAARRLHRSTGGLGLIVIDYLQLMSAGHSSANENRSTQLSDVSRGLKMLAMELDVPVVALSQLNREVEKRPNKRPVNSDLKDCGGIEQDADVILHVYRDEVYNPDSSDKGTAEIIIGKQRNGPIGSVRLTWQGKFTRFGNYSHGDDYGG